MRFAYSDTKPVAVLCMHLHAKDGLTFYYVSERPHLGLCGACFLSYGKQLEAIPAEILEPVLLKQFERKKEKSHPVFHRLIERLRQYG